MTTYATNLPFAPTSTNLVELTSPNPDYPSHYVVGHRYYANYAGKVYCAEQHVGRLMAEGCTVPPHVVVSVAPVPAAPGGLAYTPLTPGPTIDRT